MVLVYKLISNFRHNAFVVNEIIVSVLIYIFGVILSTAPSP